MKITVFNMWANTIFTPVLGCFLRAEEGAAKEDAATAATTGAGYGTQASQEGAILNPALARETQAEHAFDPTQLNEMLTAAGAGVGGAMGAADTGLKRQAATTGNAAGQAKGLDELARERMKTGAGVSEGIASQDVLGAQKLRQEGLQGEQGLYGENVHAQLGAMGQEAGDINAATNASKTGWLQNTETAAKTGADIASAF